MKFYKEICSAWISRTSADIFFSQIDLIWPFNTEFSCFFTYLEILKICKIIVLIMSQRQIYKIFRQRLVLKDFCSAKTSTRSTNCRWISSNSCTKKMKWRWTLWFQRQKYARQKLIKLSFFARQIKRLRNYPIEFLGLISLIFVYFERLNLDLRDSDGYREVRKGRTPPSPPPLYFEQQNFFVIFIKR